MKKSNIAMKVCLSALALIAALGLALPRAFTEPTKATPALSTAAATVPPVDTVRYVIDSGRSMFTVRAFVGGLFAFAGHDHTIAIDDFSGDLHLTPGSSDLAVLQMTITAGSLAEVDTEFNEKDRQEINKTMREEVLETGKYPDIVFTSTGVSAKKVGEGEYQVMISGTLTLHGVTRNRQIKAKVTISGNTLRAQGEFSLQHSDYNLKRISVAGGAVKVKEELRLAFNIVARQQ